MQRSFVALVQRLKNKKKKTSEMYFCKKNIQFLEEIIKHLVAKYLWIAGMWQAFSKWAKMQLCNFEVYETDLFYIIRQLQHFKFQNISNSMYWVLYIKNTPYPE